MLRHCRHTLATDVISGPGQGFQGTAAEEIERSSQDEIQARLRCVCALHACSTHFPRAAQTTETPETPPAPGPLQSSKTRRGASQHGTERAFLHPSPRIVHEGVLRS